MRIRGTGGGGVGPQTVANESAYLPWWPTSRTPSKSVMRASWGCYYWQPTRRAVTSSLCKAARHLAATRAATRPMNCESRSPEVHQGISHSHSRRTAFGVGLFVCAIRSVPILKQSCSTSMSPPRRDLGLVSSNHDAA